jgi:hypothetical protein
VHTLLRCAVLALCTSACGPEHGDPLEDPLPDAERFAAGVCEAANSCGCVTPFTSVEDCETTLVARFLAAVERGSEVVPDCLDAYIASLADDPCSADFEMHEGSACVALQGDRPQGDECRQNHDLAGLGTNECSSGACVVGVCSPPGTFGLGRGEGAACDPAILNHCSSDFYCGDGGTCELTRAVNEPCEPLGCDQITTANEELYCAAAGPFGNGTCAPRQSVGAPCDPLDFIPCSADLKGGGTMASTCDPTSRTCVLGAGAPLCIRLNNPLAWQPGAD